MAETNGSKPEPFENPIPDWLAGDLRGVGSRYGAPVFLCDLHIDAVHRSLVRRVGGYLLPKFNSCGDVYIYPTADGTWEIGEKGKEVRVRLKNAPLMINYAQDGKFRSEMHRSSFRMSDASGLNGAIDSLNPVLQVDGDVINNRSCICKIAGRAGADESLVREYRDQSRKNETCHKPSYLFYKEADTPWFGYADIDDIESLARNVSFSRVDLTELLSYGARASKPVKRIAPYVVKYFYELAKDGLRGRKVKAGVPMFLPQDEYASCFDRQVFTDAVSVLETLVPKGNDIDILEYHEPSFSRLHADDVRRFHKWFDGHPFTVSPTHNSLSFSLPPVEYGILGAK